MKINPSKIILPTREKAWTQTIKKGNLQAQTMFNTYNIKISVNTTIDDAGLTGHFVVPGTSVKNINPAEKYLCVNLPDGEQIKSTHTCQIYIPCYQKQLQEPILYRP